MSKFMAAIKLLLKGERPQNPAKTRWYGNSTKVQRPIFTSCASCPGHNLHSKPCTHSHKSCESPSFSNIPHHNTRANVCARRSHLPESRIHDCVIPLNPRSNPHPQTHVHPHDSTTQHRTDSLGLSPLYTGRGVLEPANVDQLLWIPGAMKHSNMISWVAWGICADL